MSQSLGEESGGHLAINLQLLEIKHLLRYSNTAAEAVIRDVTRFLIIDAVFLQAGIPEPSAEV